MTSNAPPAAGTVTAADFLMQVGATRMPHSGRSLYEHLAGVSAILHQWGQPEHVDLAGMFHSVYSTSKYKNAVMPMSDRSRLRAVIGEDAERLVYLFAALPAGTVFDAVEAGWPDPTDPSMELPCQWNKSILVRISELELSTLAVMHIANFLEQQSKPATGIRIWLSRISGLAGRLNGIFESLPDALKTIGVITAHEELRLNSLYAQGLACMQSGDARGAIPFLRDASRACHVVGEPFILLGAALLQTGDKEGASRSALQGRKAIRAWGTPWHKHLSLDEWCDLADLITGQAPFTQVQAALDAMAAARRRAQRVLNDEMRLADPEDGRTATPIAEAKPDASRLVAYLQRVRSERSPTAVKWYPGLSRRSWYDASEFPVAQELESRFAEIKAEAMNVKPSSFFEEAEDIGRTGSWQVCMFYEQGRRNDVVSDQCPATTAVLERHDSVRRSAGLIYLSKLAPRTHVVAHQARGNMRLRCHLALSIPQGDCAIRVADEVRHWQEGRCMIFDDSFEHEVWNRTDETRLVLLVDLWHPDFTETERTALDAINWISMDRARSMMGVWHRNEQQHARERERAEMAWAGSNPGPLDGQRVKNVSQGSGD